MPAVLMAQDDVFANPDGGGYLLHVQTDLLNALNVGVVLPILPQDRAPLRDRDCGRVHAVLTRQDCRMRAISSQAWRFAGLAACVVRRKAPC
jgi:hypothetical protein